MKTYKFTGSISDITKFINDAGKWSDQLKEFNRQIYLLLQDEVFKMNGSGDIIEVEGKPEITEALVSIPGFELYERFFDEDEVENYLVEVETKPKETFYLACENGFLELQVFRSIAEAKEHALQKPNPEKWAIVKADIKLVANFEKTLNPVYEMRTL